MLESIGQEEEVGDEIWRRFGFYGKILIRLFFGRLNLGFLGNVHAMRRAEILCVDFVDSGKCGVHDGLEEFEQDDLKVRHEAIGGD
jgi:hypothetical protein